MSRIGPGTGLGGAPTGGDDDGGSSSGGGGGGGGGFDPAPDPSPDNDGGRVAPDPVDGGGPSGGGSSAPASGSTTIGTDIGAPTRTDTDAIDDAFTAETLGDLATGFSQNVAGTVGDAARFASPATELDRVLPGNPV